MAYGQRIILLLLALAVISFNSISGHIVSDLRKSPVIFSNCSSPVLIRLKGESIEPGVYVVPDGSTVASVLYRARSQADRAALGDPIFRTRLESGDVLDVTGGGVGVGITRMSASERMALGIPLDPDRMGLEDWTAVPGIGPRLAKRIVDDRRAYGPFHSIEGISRVPGIGSGKLKAMKKYF